MESEDFPSFKKERRSERVSSTSGSFFLVALFIGLTAFAIFAGSRFLSGSKTPRNEILARVLEASESRQSYLLLEWLERLEKNEPGWNPTAAEQKSLVAWAAARSADLKRAGNAPATLALHVASVGSGAEIDPDQIIKIIHEAQSPEGRLAVGLYLSRQNIFTSEAMGFQSELATDSSTLLRKISVSAWERCLSKATTPAPQPATREICRTRLRGLAGDADDEVRWNTSFAVLRTKPEWSEADVTKAWGEISDLERRIKEKNPELRSRFGQTQLDDLATTIERLK